MSYIMFFPFRTYPISENIPMSNDKMYELFSMTSCKSNIVSYRLPDNAVCWSIFIPVVAKFVIPSAHVMELAWPHGQRFVTGNEPRGVHNIYCSGTAIRDPIYWQVSTLISPCLSSHINHEVWDEITYRFNSHLQFHFSKLPDRCRLM